MSLFKNVSFTACECPPQDKVARVVDTSGDKATVQDRLRDVQVCRVCIRGVPVCSVCMKDVSV